MLKLHDCDAWVTSGLTGTLSLEKSYHMSVEREHGAGISPFSAEWLDNLLSFFKEMPMIVENGTFSIWLF